jgi:hypothetical protein
LLQQLGTLNERGVIAGETVLLQHIPLTLNRAIYKSIQEQGDKKMGGRTKAVWDPNFGEGDADVRFLTLESKVSGIDNGSQNFVSQFHELMNILHPAG